MMPPQKLAMSNPELAAELALHPAAAMRDTGTFWAVSMLFGQLPLLLAS